MSIKMNTMKSTSYFESINKNHYLYDKGKSLFVNVHPVLRLIMSLSEKDNLNTSLLIERAADEFPDLAVEELEYYTQKYQFLKANGFFKNRSYEDQFGGVVSPELVEKQLANIDNIVFQITDICNLNCTYCCFGDMYENQRFIKNKHMDLSTVKKIIRYMIPYWNSDINISKNNQIRIGFYGGEPLLNIDLVKKVVDIFSKLKLNNNASFGYNMTTNGMLLDKHIDFLVEHNFDLLISLDGDKKSNSLRLDKRGNESYDIVFGNIKKIKTKYPEYFDKCVEFNSVLNINSSAPKVHQYMHREFNKIPSMATISDNQLNEDKKEEYERIRQGYSETKEMTEKSLVKSNVMQDLGTFFYNNTDNSYKHYYELLVGENNEQKRLPTGTCLPFWKKMYVVPNGEIYACERIGFDHVLGTVKENVEINTKYIADLYTQYFKNLSEQCKSCYEAESCGKCIFQFEFEKKVPICIDKKDEIQYRALLARRISVLEGEPQWVSVINKIVL